MKFTVHHVAISVHDLMVASEFYARFGFSTVFDHVEPGNLSIRHMRLGAALLELWWYEDHHPAPSSAGSLLTDLPRLGYKHLALAVESIEEAWTFVISNGIKPETQVQQGRTGISYFFVKDPSGNLFELVEDHRTF